MSYLSRLFNHRNAQTPEVNNKKPFFSKKANDKKASRGAFFQAKLSVNEPGDMQEQEANAVANAVVNNKTGKHAVEQNNKGSVQRLATSTEDEMLGTNDARMERDKEDKVKAVQRAMGPDKEKEKAVQKMDAPKKEEDKMKPVQRAMAPEKEKEKGVQKMDTPKKEEEKMKPVQRAMAPEKEKEKGVQKMETPKKEEEKKGAASSIQRKPEGASQTASPQVSSRIENTAGTGSSLPKTTLHEMNASFRTDFSNVHIHQDSEAASLNESLEAQAFTHGTDIYFNSGKFNPENQEGKHLLAHELTHVVQQTGRQNMVSKSETTSAVADTNGCRRITETPCPGSADNATRLGYREVMNLKNIGDCQLFIHSIDGSGNIIQMGSFSIQPGETKIYYPSANAVDTVVVCSDQDTGNGRLEHPYYCA
jgi:hypothetical protein